MVLFDQQIQALCGHCHLRKSTCENARQRFRVVDHLLHLHPISYIGAQYEHFRAKLLQFLHSSYFL